MKHRNILRVESDVTKEVMTTTDAAIFLQMNVATVRRLFHAGKLPGRRVGKKILFLRAQLSEFLRQQQN